MFMKHLTLLFYILSFSTGVMAVGISVILYAQLKKKVIKYYSIFLTSLALMIISVSLQFYLKFAVNSGNEFVLLNQIFSISGSFGFLLFIYVAPLFFHHLFRQELTRNKKIVFNAITASAIIFSIMYYWLNIQIVTMFLNIILYGMVAYGLITFFFIFEQNKSHDMGKGLSFFFWITLSSFPLFIYDVYWGKKIFLALPLYYLFVNIFSFIFSFRFFKTHKPSNNFTSLNKKYEITKREFEIIEFLKKGSTTKEVGEKLFISPKTVENHIYNIYKKTSVKNRIQLLNIINSAK